MKRIFYIYNPFSGGQVNGKQLDTVLQRLMSAGILVSVHRLFTMQPDLALEDFFLHRQSEYDAIFVAGGDGTLSQMLDYAMRHGCRLPMGFLPTGTCNDLVRSLGFPKDAMKCLDLLIEALQRDTYTAMDIGRITAAEDRSCYFLNSVAGGVFVDISHKTKPEAKKRFGALAYYATALGELINIRPFRLRIETEDRIFDESVFLFILLNGTDVAGFSGVIGDADMQDGKMDLLILRDGNAIATLQAGLQLTRAQKNAKSFELLRCRRCTVTADPAPVVSVDGEKGPALPYEIETLPGALRLVGRPHRIGNQSRALPEETVTATLPEAEQLRQEIRAFMEGLFPTDISEYTQHITEGE